VTIDDINIVELSRINVAGGDVFKGIDVSSSVFKGFGEFYFSNVEFGYRKAWKRHLQMTMFLTVPVGHVNFVFIDSQERRLEIAIGEESYRGLQVPPGLWFGFEGIGKGKNLVMNLADIRHDPNEVERRSVDFFPFMGAES
jgi:dTDP-4-dehydrorhamnose 3,5-epimerase